MISKLTYYIRAISTTLYMRSAIGWSALICIMSLMPSRDINSLKLIQIEGLDKILHFVCYLLLSFLWMGAFKNRQGSTKYIIFFTLTFGGLMEIFQFYLSLGRSLEAADMLANSLGIFLGIILFNKFINQRSHV
jgi:hypothetical protein